jgi:5'-nucleotidase / UDP-sugar diphosphatase
VTTRGEYRYVGNLIVKFNEQGLIDSVDPSSGPVRVTTKTGDPDQISPDMDVLTQVVNPVNIGITAMAANVIATTEVELDGWKADLRTKETNLGDLLADGILFEGRIQALALSAPAPDLAIVNAGSVRTDFPIPAGNLSMLDSYNIAPYSDFITLVQSVSPADLKQVLENAVSSLPAAQGKFPLIAGLSITVDPHGAARVGTADGTETTAGARIKEAKLANLTSLITNYIVDAGAPNVNLVTYNFLAAGGDGYPLKKYASVVSTVTYQQAFVNFLKASGSGGGLNGTVPAEKYPNPVPAGSERILILP